MLGSRLSTMAMVPASLPASTSDLMDCCGHNLLGQPLLWLPTSPSFHIDLYGKMYS